MVVTHARTHTHAHTSYLALLKIFVAEELQRFLLDLGAEPTVTSQESVEPPDGVSKGRDQQGRNGQQERDHVVVMVLPGWHLGRLVAVVGSALVPDHVLGPPDGLVHGAHRLVADQLAEPLDVALVSAKVERWERLKN